MGQDQMKKVGNGVHVSVLFIVVLLFIITICIYYLFFFVIYLFHFMYSIYFCII